MDIWIKKTEREIKRRSDIIKWAYEGIPRLRGGGRSVLIGDPLEASQTVMEPSKAPVANR